MAKINMTVNQVSAAFWAAVLPLILLRFGASAFLIIVGKDLTNQTSSFILYVLSGYFAVLGVLSGMRAANRFFALREQLKEMSEND